MSTKTEAPLIDLLDASDAPAVAMPGGMGQVPAVQQGGQVSAAAPAQGPMANALAWMQAGGTIEQLRDMLALQKEWEAHEAKKAYTEAMAAFKKNPPEILKDKRVFFKGKEGATDTEYWHATLGNVAEKVIAGLAEHGFSHAWTPKREGDRIHVTCTLTHRLGHSESITMDGPLDVSGKKNPIQSAMSTTSYLSRYTLLLITGLAVKDAILPFDDDGNSAGEDVPDRNFPDVHPQLLQDARDAALGGSVAFDAFYQGLEEKWRRNLSPAMDSLKAAAKLADQPAAGAPKA